MATWASSTCTMTNGKQAAWTTMLSSGGGGPNGDHGDGDATATPPPPPKPAATLTGSDLVKGGETPVLLAADSLGRVGLLRYPAQLPPEPTLPTAVPTPPVEGDGGEEGGAGAGAPPGPTPEEAEAAATAAAATMAEAVDAAVPRVRFNGLAAMLVLLPIVQVSLS